MSSSNEAGAQHEREIQEDVMNVPFIAWLGTVSAILIATSVLLLIGVYYLTLRQEMKQRYADADVRINDIEAQRIIDAELVEDGYFVLPETEDAEGNVQRGTTSVPIELGMEDVITSAQGKKPK